jgi:hypothetical protein
MFKHILVFMYRTKQYQRIWGEVAFYHQNPGFDSTAGDQEILAGVLMRHIAMVRSTRWVILKGLTKPDQPHIIQRLDEDDPEEVDMQVKRSIWKIMMEKKIQGTKVWVLITQIPDRCWAGYFRYGFGNNLHHAHALEWSGAVSSHIRFHLLCQGFESEGVNDLVQESFDLQATREAAEAIQDNDGQIKTRSQAAAEQVLQRHDQTQLWVDLTLGMTKHQKEEHEQQQATQATAKAKADGLDCSYNFEDAHFINLVEGRPDRGTAFTKTRNVSLEKTAYDVVLQSDESDLEDIFSNPYSNDKDNNRVKLEMKMVHCQTGKIRGHSRPSSSEEGGSNSKASAASELEKEQGAAMGNTEEAPGSQDATMSNNEEAPGSAGGGGDMVSHVALVQDLAKTMLQAMETTPSQDQVPIPNKSKGLAPVGE